MGAVRVKTTNDRLLEIDYSDTEAVKKIISSWGMVEKLAEGGDTVASAILVDLQTAIGVSITEFGENKKVGFDVSRINRGVLTEAQFISLIYVLGLGYRQDEIAYVLGCKKQTVNVHIQRALKRICRFLEKEDSKGEKNREHDPYYTSMSRGKAKMIKHPYLTPDQEVSRQRKEIPITCVSNVDLDYLNVTRQ